MVTEVAVLDLIERIYSAAEDPRLWNPFLNRLSEAVHAKVTAFVSEDFRIGKANVTKGVRFEGPISIEYEQYYASRNVWMMAGKETFRTGDLVTSQLLVPELVKNRVLQRSPQEDEFAPPHGRRRLPRARRHVAPESGPAPSSRSFS